MKILFNNNSHEGKLPRLLRRKLLAMTPSKALFSIITKIRLVTYRLIMRMINFRFANRIKEQIPLFIFVKDYNYILVSHTIPLLMIGMKIFEHLNQLYDQKINGILGFICVAILVLLSFSVSHIKFLRKYTHRYFTLSRSGKLIDDIKFICTLWIVTGVLNIFVQMSFVGDVVYRILSLYLIQLPILFLMLRTKCFGYRLQKRNPILSD